ncbi:Pyrimidine-specific ribonucleoside hydrolase RihA [Variovorax sp. SRS16]|uniref:nucleoside hydrolase n=1 Tax=Variovorax sp. SRS16 TaxID=282217 RepID=UPI001317E043|nr:nucleoside hydrolase [Variovorax sp. SRS16]VTU28984.1 Pyrimidine-specific ribonucleoside hydrolase RihA [Variovorax sp. SRS16]
MKRVWIDTDMGFDDLAAVLTVAQTPGWRIDGLSLVAGNAPLEVVIDNALRAAAYFGWDFPIHAGCARPLAGELVTAQNILGADAMGSAGRSLPPARAALADVDAVGALGCYLAAAGEPAALLALGPLTNIATLLRQRPELAARIAPLMWMGGSAGPGNHTAAAEFNAAVDPEAINAVLDAGVPLQMVGLDACRQVRVHAADADALRALGTDKAEVLADLLLGYVRIASSDGSLPMALYDPSAAAALVAPEGMRFRPAHVVAECQGEHTRGMTVVEWRVPRRATANALVASVADEALLRRVVLDALAQAARAA